MRKTCTAFCWLPLMWLALFLVSCKGNQSIDLGNKEPLSLQLTDSVDVQCSTYLLDSLPTSNLGVVLTGEINDPDFGRTSANSYLQLKPSGDAATALPAGAAFDSLSLVMPYNGYYYGDTIPVTEMKVYRLKQDIVLRKFQSDNLELEKPVFTDGDALYNTSSFSFDPIALGSRSFKPRPALRDTLRIRLQDALGKELFNLLVNKDGKITNNQDFLDYFKGVFLKADHGNSMLGFNADGIKMRVHYSFRDQYGLPAKGLRQFDLNAKDKQFNHIESDRTGTLLNGLGPKMKKLSDEATKHQFFAQAGTGIVTRLYIPGLKNLVEGQKVSVNSAELVIETNAKTYSVYKAPPTMMLFISNTADVPKSVLTIPFTKNNQFAPFQAANDYGTNARYIFQLTEYANEVRKGNYKNTTLLLSLPLSQLFNTVDRLHVLQNKDIKTIKLKIHYTKI